jgi:succinyl-CoA synthetase beta subunit
VPGTRAEPTRGWEGLAEMLEHHGVHVVPSRLVETEDELRAAVVELGLPVAVKLPSDEFDHKTEHGGVRLDLETVDEAATAFRELAALPGRTSQRAHVQRLLREAVEVIASVREDPDLGPVLAVGPGGIFVELVGELAYRVLPVADEELEELLFETRLGRLLAGFRGGPPADADALAASLRGLADAFEANPWLREIELNPLLVLPRGQGAFAVDVWADHS